MTPIWACYLVFGFLFFVGSPFFSGPTFFERILTFATRWVYSDFGCRSPCGVFGRVWIFGRQGACVARFRGLNLWLGVFKVKKFYVGRFLCFGVACSGVWFFLRIFWLFCVFWCCRLDSFFCGYFKVGMVKKWVKMGILRFFDLDLDEHFLSHLIDFVFENAFFQTWSVKPLRILLNLHSLLLNLLLRPHIQLPNLLLQHFLILLTNLQYIFLPFFLLHIIQQNDIFLVQFGLSGRWGLQTAFFLGAAIMVEHGLKSRFFLGFGLVDDGDSWWGLGLATRVEDVFEGLRAFDVDLGNVV